MSSEPGPTPAGVPDAEPHRRWPHSPDAPSPEPAYGPLAGGPTTIYAAAPRDPHSAPSSLQAPVGPRLEPTRPRRWGRWLALALVGAALVGAVAVPLLTPTPRPGGSATPTPSATSASPVSGMPFKMPSDPNSGGTWEILETRWTSEGVSLKVRVTCTQGKCSYGFMAFGQNATTLTRPTTGPDTPELDTGTLQAGETTIGYVFLEIDRRDATLILTTAIGRQISALPIKA